MEVNSMRLRIFCLMFAVLALTMLSYGGGPNDLSGRPAAGPIAALLTLCPAGCRAGGIEGADPASSADAIFHDPKLRPVPHLGLCGADSDGHYGKSLPRFSLPG